MSGVLDALGPAIWRASWQAATIALVVVAVLRILGDRIAPRWRYLLWSIVLFRLLIIAAPPSPWSAFNLLRWEHGKPIEQSADHITAVAVVGQPADDQEEHAAPKIAEKGSPAELGRVRSIKQVAASPTLTDRTTELPAIVGGVSFEIRFIRLLTVTWLAGCLLLALRFLLAAVVLNRRLSACHSVIDATVLELLECTRRQFRLRSRPELLVSPEPTSPCVLGIWRPRIVVPELLITDTSLGRLRHVLAHELAHLVRGDLWTNWLLLAARVLYWFNPVAWWTVREMQSEREAACDELALAVLGDGNRSTYARTILGLAMNLKPSVIAPGMIGLFSSARRMRKRIERLDYSTSAATLGAPIMLGLLLGIGTFGLTDSVSIVTADETKTKELEPKNGTASSIKDAVPEASDFTILGSCIDQTDSTPLAGIRVRLFMATGRTSPPVIIAQAVTDAQGRYKFENLAPERPYEPLARRVYAVVAEDDKRPTGIGLLSLLQGQKMLTIPMARESATLSGIVVDDQGKAVAGASVAYWLLDDRAIPAVLSAITDANGRFAIAHMIARSPAELSGFRGLSFRIAHPDYPTTWAKAAAVPTDVVVTLAKGCIVSGTVAEAVLGRPAVDAVVTFEDLQMFHEAIFSTDAAGRFRAAVPAGRYNIRAEAAKRVCVAITDREFSGETAELPPLKLIQGGFIAGQVINKSTGKPVSVTDRGERITVGLIGPSRPLGKAISPTPLATVDEEGRFQLQAAPGENFPYFVNIRGDRMGWDTKQQPAVVVKDGETTSYNMTITPAVPPAEKLKAAAKIVEGLPNEPKKRTEAILDQFRKLSYTVDETELWCMLMRELVAIGPNAVPQLCAELDETTEDRTLRRLGFALRAIGDPRAVPALIRALPKTMLPAASDYGLIVEDAELTTFMQQHDLNGGKRGKYFDFGRAVREIVGALHKLTKQDFKDDELFGISLSNDPRRQVLQRRFFVQQARRWQAWWEENWQQFTDDAKYQKVNLVVAEEPLPPASKSLGPNAKLSDGDGIQGMILSPAAQKGKYADHFLDLDTGRVLQWPAQLVRDEEKLDSKQLAAWAGQNGVDLMCVTHQSPEGISTYVLRAFEMKVWEISPRDLQNLDKLVAAGKLPEGRAVDELLMHYDDAMKEYVPTANAAFIYVTREGCMGLIEITDHVTRTENLTGMAGDPPQGVGFFKGVRFNLKTIVP